MVRHPSYKIDHQHDIDHILTKILSCLEPTTHGLKFPTIFPHTYLHQLYSNAPRGLTCIQELEIKCRNKLYFDSCSLFESKQNSLAKTLQK